MNRLLNFIFLFVVLLLSIFPIQAAYAKIDPILDQLQAAADDYIKTYGKEEYISAVTLSVNSPSLKKTETVLSGYTDFSSSNPLAEPNLYQIGSITKSFISVILLQLEATPGINFSINDTLSKYLPQYPQWGDITVKQLLNMTSGIPNYTEDYDFWRDQANNPYRIIQPDDLVAYTYGKPLRFSPGEGWHYSNTNYILAGMVIQKITGHTVTDEINSRFLKPGNSSNLSLNNTFYLTDSYPDAIYQRMVHGYMHAQKFSMFFPLKTDVTSFSLSWAGAAGALTGTPADVINWVQALFSSTKLLPNQQQIELESCVSLKTGKPPTQDDDGCFGLGIGKEFSSEGIVYMYEGGTLGYRVIYYYFPREQITIAIGVNSAADVDHTDVLINKVYEILNGSPNRIQKSKKSTLRLHLLSKG